LFKYFNSWYFSILHLHACGHTEQLIALETAASFVVLSQQIVHKIVLFIHN